MLSILGPFVTAIVCTMVIRYLKSTESPDMQQQQKRSSLWAIVVALSLAYTSHAATVVRVIDGDTIRLEDGRVIRLAGIDAPESNQPYGESSLRWLTTLVLDREVELYEVKRASWGRQQARLTWRKVDVNGWMVRWGAAWVDDRYPMSLTDQWKSYQSSARSRRIGLWKASSPVSPWRWREGVRNSAGESRHLLKSYGFPVVDAQYYFVAPRLYYAPPVGTACVGGT